MVLATVKRLSTLLTRLEQTLFREICRLFHIANPKVASHHTHCPFMVAQERTVLGEGAASGQIEGTAVIIGTVRRSAARGEVLHKFRRRKEAGVHEECPRLDEWIRGKKHNELGHVSDRGIGDQRPHEEVGLGEARDFFINELVVEFENYRGRYG